MGKQKRFLIRHLGNMGDMVFFIPPVLETLKKKYPDSHITFVTAWGYKQKLPWSKIVQMSKLKIQEIFSRLPSPWERPATWGLRNQDGYCISLMMTNPHIDQLVHWHDSKLDLAATTCCEEDRCFPTWSKKYYEEQKDSGAYDNAFELDFGLKIDDDPIQRMYTAVSLPNENFSNYRLYFTESDKTIAEAVMRDKPHPRVVLLEGLGAQNTRGWDPDKVPALEHAIKETYGVAPIWFGGKYIPHHNGQPLTLRQNIATLLYADLAIGVMSGPLHFAAAAGLPTLTLYADQPLHRAAPAYFLNDYIIEPERRHRTLIGPSPTPMTFLKSEHAPTPLTEAECDQQHYESWQNPGRQATKSALAPLTVDEIMSVLHDMLSP